jgi:hypothetical protein
MSPLQSVIHCYIIERYSMPAKTLHLDPYLTGVLMRDLVGHDRRPAAFFVYLWLSIERQNRAQHRNFVSISYQDLAESIGISKSATQSAVAWLVRRKLLAVTKATVTATPAYEVLSPWKNRQSGRSTSKLATKPDDPSSRQLHRR